AITPASERLLPGHFMIGSTSPARGAGIVIPPHFLLGPLPDSRASRDIGAIPYGTAASEFQRFPFDPGSGSGPPLLDAPGPGPAATLRLRVTPHPVVDRARLGFSIARAGPVRIAL